jgi:hypothetical protein
MPTGIYKRNKSLKNLFQKGFKPWNTGLKYKGNPRPKLKGKKFGTPFPKGNIPWNKNTKGLIKHNKGCYKPGDESPNWKGGVSIGKNRKIYYQIKTLERLARKKNAKGSFTLDEWQRLTELSVKSCVCCGRREPEIKLTIDHIKPLIYGGSNSIDNIQPLCLSCNCKKNTKEIKFIGLPKYIDKVDFLNA